MHTLETINEELKDYCTYMNCELPPIVHLQHCELDRIKAKFLPDTPTKGEHTIILTPIFYNQDIQNQQATLWHEFTHLYDWYFNDIKSDSLTVFLYTYSEAHATEIQYRKLLSLNTRQTIGKETRLINDSKKQPYKNTVALYLLNAKEQFEKFQSNKSNDNLTEFVRLLSYYCGCCMLYNSTIQKAYVNSLVYISDKYKQYFIDYANAVLGRDFDNVDTTRKELILNIMFH